MGVEPFLIASSVVIIVAQRLVRKLCDKCKQAYKPTPDLVSRIGMTQQQAESTTFYKAVGCDDCLNMGYKGRLAIFEVMEVSDAASRLIVQRVDSSIIKAKALEEGMTTLAQDGVRRIQDGDTTIEEVLSVAHAGKAIEESQDVQTARPDEAI